VHAADLAIAFPILEHGVKTADEETAATLCDLLQEARSMANDMHEYAHPYGGLLDVTPDQLPNLRMLNFVRAVVAGAVYQLAHSDGTFVADYTASVSPSHKRLVRQLATKRAPIPAPPR
jgi:hypothetical protein